MRNMKSIIYLALCFYCLSACVNDTDTKQNSSSKYKTNERAPVNPNLPINIYTTGNDKYILFDTIRVKIPVEINITAANIYDGIYECKSDSLERHKVLITKKLAFLTDSEDLGLGA